MHVLAQVSPSDFHCLQTHYKDNLNFARCGLEAVRCPKLLCRSLPSLLPVLVFPGAGTGWIYVAATCWRQRCVEGGARLCWPSPGCFHPHVTAVPVWSGSQGDGCSVVIVARACLSLLCRFSPCLFESARNLCGAVRVGALNPLPHGWPPPRVCAPPLRRCVGLLCDGPCPACPRACLW